MISLVFALEYESAAFRRAQSEQMCISLWHLGVTGERSANALKRRLATNRPTMIVSAGFGGALRDDMPLGALIIGANYTAPDILRHLKTPQGSHVGDIATASKILETASERKQLAARTGAVVGDLETAHIYGICKLCDIPMLALRSISDTVDQKMPVPASILINPQTCKPDPFALFSYIFRHPGKMRDLVKLIHGARVAQQTLAEGLEIIIPQLLRMKLQ